MAPSSVRCYTFAVGGAGGGDVGDDVPGGVQMNASCFLPASPSCNEIETICYHHATHQQLCHNDFLNKMLNYKINRLYYPLHYKQLL